MTPPPRLLIVDDEPLISFSMGRYFQGEGFHVDCASDLERAQQLVAAGDYDVVIADLRLTGAGSTEGLDLITFASERSPRTRAILLTSYGSPEIELEARRRGAHAMMVKPQALPELAGVVARLIERHAEG
jgi:two-component system NtrC family response regulator